MAKRTDKRTSNLIIAGGYCLVAVIILFNYLGQTSRTRTAGQIVSVVPATAEGNDLQSLRKQLEEEKKVNSEMRTLLRQIQRTGSIVPAQKTGSQNPIQDLDKSLPELNTDLLQVALKPRQNPFTPGKNPYAPIRKTESIQKPVSSGFPFARSLKCDPRLPYLFSGANSASMFLGN
jgi:hypothetical protein